MNLVFVDVDPFVFLMSLNVMRISLKYICYLKIKVEKDCKKMYILKSMSNVTLVYSFFASTNND